MKSVDKAKSTTGEEPAVEVAVEASAPVEAAPEVSSAEVAALKAELATANTELNASQAMSRDLMTKFKDEHEKLMRAAADLDNFKKRAQKEKEEVQKFGQEKLLKDFFPIFDNFDRALEHAKGPDDYASLRKGVEMIRKLFIDTLGKHQVKPFSAKGKPFDPTMHEAMSQAESADMPPNHVFAEILTGFTLNDRMVRPALVVVSKAPAAPAPAAAATETKTEETKAPEKGTDEPAAE